MTSTLTEITPSPVFVDQTGRRGRRLRGLGWVFGAAFVGATLAMVSGLLGTQSDAPSFAVPDGANTAPPGQYLNAPLPSPPGKATRNKSARHTTQATPADTATPTKLTGGATASLAAPTHSPTHSTAPAPNGRSATAPAKPPAKTRTTPPAHTTPPAPSATTPTMPSGTSAPRAAAAPNSAP